MTPRPTSFFIWPINMMLGARKTNKGLLVWVNIFQIVFHNNFLWTIVHVSNQTLLPCLQTIRVSGRDSRTVMGRTWPVLSEAVLTGLPVRKSVSLALVLLSSNWIKQNFIYHCLGGANVSFNRIFQFYDSCKVKFDLHGPEKWKWVHMKIQLVSFVV